MLLRHALPATHFDRNAAIPVTDLVHWESLPFAVNDLLFRFRGGLALVVNGLRLEVWRLTVCY